MKGEVAVSELKAVIQAGGLGTRLAPYSTVLPKALMPIGDETIIDHLLGQFRDAGVEQVLITVSRFGPLIRSYCGDGSRWGLEIEYVTEDEPLGTIGPLNNVRDRLNGTFFVVNSDVYTDLELKDLLAHHESSSAPMTVVVTRQAVDIARRPPPPPPSPPPPTAGSAASGRSRPRSSRSARASTACGPRSSASSRRPARSASIS
jgi:GTP:adenosylcobinamide-phosphate guanylyltransferase